MENYRNRKRQSDWGFRPSRKEDLDLLHQVKNLEMWVLAVGKESVEWVVSGGSYR